ncbi:Glucose 1-dehydrogenase, putative [Theobroma cacao]|uniref:Glucose 1-dehydrogenase, putative n=1 Tax=Theobroma cacao TaxID=3641 RepID=A0A061G030_THECC|nr:Glucose 1-dehydrogenase, putative [Theobroma cacao]
MDLINKFMNAIVATISLIALFFLLHHYRFFKSLLSTVRTIFKENVTGKVILITGASSGVGENLAYKYARRGARLALVARREHRLQEVAAIFEITGSPEAIYILGDISKIEDCKRFVDATVNHFGHLDHLVTSAGVAPVCLFEDYDDITKASPAMDINFWASQWPKASKAALISFYETLRIEFRTQIGITIVTLGLIKTEMTEGKFLSREGKLVVDREMRDVQVSLMPLESADKCAKAVVDSACRGENYLTLPSWTKATLLWKVFCPEIIEWWNRLLLMTGPGSSHGDVPSKKIFDVASRVKKFSLWMGGPFPKIVIKAP